LKEISSVTCFLTYKGKILILLRSNKVRSYQGIWGGVSGRIQDGHTPLEQARLEVLEETEIPEKEIVSIKEGQTMVFDDNEVKIRKVVYPFLFQIKDPGKVKIDWEHTQSAWINPEEMESYDTMPKLKETLLRVLN
jgi:ADP-ribose pyrophosphatase YjhB (NUDIX family)